MDTSHSKIAPTPVSPTAARREQIRERRMLSGCDCGAAELLDYVEFLEAELVRASRRLETLEARLSRNPGAAISHRLSYRNEQNSISK